jgi:hypothetical protein
MADAKSSVELYRQLKEAIGEKSADAIVVFLDHFLREEGVTKTDINELKIEMDKFKTEFYKEIAKTKISLIKWMVGLMLGLLVSLTTIMIALFSFMR